MILDERNEFADALALNTGAAGTYNLGDQIDLSVARDIGGDGALYLVVQATTDIVVGSGTGTIQFQLVSDSVPTPATDGSQTVHVRSAAIATATTAAAALKAGATILAIQLPLEGLAYERYLGLQQVTGSTAISGGAINAFLTKDVKQWKAYDAPFHL